MTWMKRNRWLTLLIGLGAIALCMVAAGLVLVAGQELSTPAERLRNTTETQEGVFLAASNDYFEHISQRPVLEPSNHELKMLDGYQVWLATESIQIVNQVCTGAISVNSAYLLEATIRLEKVTATVFYTGGSGKATYWRLHIDRLKRCRLGN